jgi:hypothetical protein
MVIVFSLQQGFGQLIGLWSLWGTAALLSFLFFRTRLGFLGVTGALGLVCFFLIGLLFWTFHAFTGKTAVLKVEVQKVEGTAITLRVTDLKKGGTRTFEVTGDKWGISANVALVKDWVVLLGGKTYYRLNSVVGLDMDGTQGDYYTYPFDEMTDGMWNELERHEDRLPGIRSVYEDVVLKQPIEGRTYTIYVDNDGSIVPELEHD